MNKEGRKIKKLYDNYLALKSVVEGTAFLTEDGILVELELVRARQTEDKNKEEYFNG
ncbi:MAG: hypothetical protein IJH64_05300 [Oscillospiraceae bacterium]|nr:hypothetical protein [Eubacterium sp.]MBR0341647.1 hypothetical protein [Oscillospiraceae bacterium]